MARSMFAVDFLWSEPEKENSCLGQAEPMLETVKRDLLSLWLRNPGDLPPEN